MARQRDENKREIIREAAIEVISEAGFHQATTDRIAAVAGVSVGTIYNYFRNKEDILAYIYEISLRRRKAWFDELETADIGSTYDKLQVFIGRHFSDLAAEPGLAQILVREKHVARMNGLAEPVLRYFELLRSATARILEQGQRKGEVRPDLDVRLAALALFGALEAATQASVESPETFPMAETGWHLLRLIWDGLEVSPGQA